jgi:hypothetical protein
MARDPDDVYHADLDHFDVARGRETSGSVLRIPAAARVGDDRRFCSRSIYWSSTCSSKRRSVPMFFLIGIWGGKGQDLRGG